MYQQDQSPTLYRIAFRLSVFTIAFNIAEGIVSMFFGYRDESLTLFGFGVDSFIEVVSGVGIAHMVVQTWRNPTTERYEFERVALSITGYAFYALTLGLLVTASYNVITGQRPEATFVGVIVSSVSIAIMIILRQAKTRVGTRLGSPAIMADAQCTKVCIYMSIVLLAASGLYELTRIPYADTLGSAALAYLSFNEGRECFAKGKSDDPYLCDLD